MPRYKNLIFDIGNVLVDIDYAAPVAEFGKLAVHSPDDILGYSKKNQLFERFERGQISAGRFRDELKPWLRPDVADEEIQHAWNSILIHYPPEKFELLNRLKAAYKVLALSNINETHVEAINQAVREQFGARAFSDFFHTAYYSNEVGHRKPEPEIYRFVIETENLNPDETFFVDDMPENVAAAKAAGLQAFLLPQPQQLTALLLELNII